MDITTQGCCPVAKGETKLAAPGWYPDPNNPRVQRYWDGGRWTDHYAPLAGTTSSAANVGPAATPHYGHVVRITLTAAITLIALVGVILAIAWFVTDKPWKSDVWHRCMAEDSSGPQSFQEHYCDKLDECIRTGQDLALTDCSFATEPLFKVGVLGETGIQHL